MNICIYKYCNYKICVLCPDESKTVAEETKILQAKYKHSLLCYSFNNELPWMANPQSDMCSVFVGTSLSGNAVKWKFLTNKVLGLKHSIDITQMPERIISKLWPLFYIYLKTTMFLEIINNTHMGYIVFGVCHKNKIGKM